MGSPLFRCHRFKTSAHTNKFYLQYFFLDESWISMLTCICPFLQSMMFYLENSLLGSRLVLAFLKEEEVAPQVLHQCLSSKWGSSVQPLEPNIEQSFIDYYSQWWWEQILTNGANIEQIFIDYSQWWEQSACKPKALKFS